MLSNAQPTYLTDYGPVCRLSQMYHAQEASPVVDPQISKCHLHAHRAAYLDYLSGTSAVSECLRQQAAHVKRRSEPDLQ